MLKEIFIVVFTLAVCHADPVPRQGIVCGLAPTNVNTCMGSPAVYSDAVLSKCTKSGPMCDRFKCLFKESGWLKDDKVDKKKISDYFDTFASDHPAWATAVNHLKVACLGDHDLPAQGTYLNCPAVDITHCIYSSFIRNVIPSQWRPGPECAEAREYASACPVCPNDCFAPQVPNDSCHACYSLPRSA